MARPVAWHSVWLVALTLPLCPVPAQHSARSSLDSVRRALDEYATRAEAQGVSGVLLVASRDDVVLHRAIGWRDAARSIPNDTTTLFYIASIAKQFVAAAILQLEDAGRLRTTDSIARFFPEAPADKRSITVDQLLAHTSGLGRYGFDPARRDWAVENREQGTRGILGSTLAHVPGTQFDYQNTNYLLLGEIVERVSGVPLDTYLDQRLFAPVGLRDT
jgi:CubicO group peptidase (beta-lactamase class C family)